MTYNQRHVNPFISVAKPHVNPYISGANGEECKGVLGDVPSFVRYKNLVLLGAISSIKKVVASKMVTYLCEWAIGYLWTKEYLLNST